MKSHAVNTEGYFRKRSVRDTSPEGGWMFIKFNEADQAWVNENSRPTEDGKRVWNEG